MSEVCQCKNKDHTVGICVGQIKEHQKEIDKFFKILSIHCEHHANVLCLIPVKLYPEIGVVFCTARNCPLLKEK